MTIVRLSAENVKRLRAVTIEPDGNLVVLSGRNGQGKTSVLDAITYALAGKREVCAEPVRRGQEVAEIVCDLGELVVRRRFTASGGTTLEVTSRDGLRHPSPQAILDKLVGELTFDPLAFARRAPKEQQEILRALVGLDFAAQDRQQEALYNERTMVNRELKTAEARLKAMPPMHAGVPAEPVSAGDLAAEVQRAQAHNAEVTRRRDRMAAIDNRAKQLQAELDALAAEYQAIAAKPAELVDVAPLIARLADLDKTNAKVRANQQRMEAEKEAAAKKTRSDDLTSQIDEIQQWKAHSVAAAKMPVPGLAFDDAGVTLNGLPLDQASAAEQLRVSVAIGIAMNPRLRVLLIRDASLLDTDSLRMVAEMAQRAGAQVWCEMVHDGSGVGIVIEDGMVQAATGAPS